MNVLLTGSSGWLGRFLAPRLREDGHRVVGLDICSGTDTEIVGSITDPALIDRTFTDREIEAVIHAGALHKPGMARYPSEAFSAVNIIGTRNLLQAASANRCKRFVFTSTTSLMISDMIRGGKAAGATRAAWLDEDFGPIEPRNIYGLTKHTAEQLCSQHHREHGLPIIVLRTGRFFPEDDDTDRDLTGPNKKANEFLNRRLTVEDAAEAHVSAMSRASEVGFGLYIVSAPPPFVRADTAALIEHAPGVIASYFPDAAELYELAGWRLPESIDRVYDPSLAQRDLAFRCRTDFSSVLNALRSGSPLPFIHDPSYVSPSVAVGWTDQQWRS